MSWCCLCVDLFSILLILNSFLLKPDRLGLVIIGYCVVVVLLCALVVASIGHGLPWMKILSLCLVRINLIRFYMRWSCRGFYSCSSFVNQECLLLCSALLLDCRHFLFLRFGLGSYHSPVQFGVIANLWKLCRLQHVYNVRHPLVYLLALMLLRLVRAVYTIHHFLRTAVSQLCLWCVRYCLFFFPFINPLYWGLCSCFGFWKNWVMVVWWPFDCFIYCETMFICCSSRFYI